MLLPPRKQELANAPRDSNANKDDLEEDGTGFDLGNEDGAAIAQQLLTALRERKRQALTFLAQKVSTLSVPVPLLFAVDERL